jgi:hypothetical protein
MATSRKNTMGEFPARNTRNEKPCANLQASFTPAIRLPPFKNMARGKNLICAFGSSAKSVNVSHAAQ